MGILSGINPWDKPRSNYAGTTTPAVTDDAGDGYSVGSVWIDLVTDSVYECTDATVGSAVWAPLGSATVPDVVAAANLTNLALVIGDGGAKGVKSLAAWTGGATGELSLTYAGAGDALAIALANTSLGNDGIVFTDALNAVRTGNFIKATACALATGAMIDLTPGAATTAAINVHGGKLDLFGDGTTILSAPSQNLFGFYTGGTTLRFGVNTGGFIAYDGGSVPDVKQIRFGNGDDAAFTYATAQTPDSLVLGLSADSNNLIVCRKADIAYDFARPIRTNPTICLESAAQSATAWTELSHGLIETGAGNLVLKPVAGSYVAFGAYTAGDPTTTGYILMAAENGTVYRVPVLANV